jgi:hypothetical protein
MKCPSRRVARFGVLSGSLAVFDEAEVILQMRAMIAVCASRTLIMRTCAGAPRIDVRQRPGELSTSSIVGEARLVSCGHFVWWGGGRVVGGWWSRSGWNQVLGLGVCVGSMWGGLVQCGTPLMMTACQPAAWW